MAIAIAGGSHPFQFYKSGVLDDPACGTDVDHAVLLVGFGSDPSSATSDYFRIKNSWGTGWGEHG